MKTFRIRNFFYSIALALCTVMLFSCGSTKIDTTQLDSDVFELKQIGFYSFDRYFSTNGQTFFEKLPLERCFSCIEETYGITVNRDLFTNTADAVAQINPNSPSGWTVKSNKESPQNITIDLIVPAYQPNDITVVITIEYTKITGEKILIERKELMHLYDWKKEAGLR